MGLLTTETIVKWTPYVKTYYTEKGYIFTKLWDTFTIKTVDLPLKSCEMVRVKCDYCGIEKEIRYSTYITNYYLETVNKYACLVCSGKMRVTLPYELIKTMIESLGEGYRLLSKIYEHNTQPLEIQCSEGHVYTTTYNSVKQGCKCSECFRIKWIGENNPNYNPNLTDEERILNRDTLQNIDWRNSVYQKDNYTCQRCGQRGNKLNAHHLNGYNWCIEERFIIDNGITLCEDCHKEFHHVYGSKNNTKEQYNSWIKSKSATA